MVLHLINPPHRPEFSPSAESTRKLKAYFPNWSDLHDAIDSGQCAKVYDHVGGHVCRNAIQDPAHFKQMAEAHALQAQAGTMKILAQIVEDLAEWSRPSTYPGRATGEREDHQIAFLRRAEEVIRYPKRDL